jgi:cathepsin A (carboxypeptidase C)
MKDYQTKVSGLLANNTRVLIYAGDVDYICNWIGNKQWTLALDWAGKTAFNSAGDNAWNTVNGNATGLLRQASAFSFLQVRQCWLCWVDWT